jgi:hypothetical protein
MPAAGAAKPPETVVVGTYLNQIFSVDLKNNSFNVDFYVWMRWTDDSLNPLDTMQLVNGRISGKTAVAKKKVGGMNVASARIVATITKFWVLDRFPLDNHELTIELEDGGHDISGIVYLADTSNAGTSEAVEVPGWQISSTKAQVAQHLYKIRLQEQPAGEGAAANQPGGGGPTKFSRYIYSTFVVRPGYGRFIKIFLGLFVAILISHLSFFIRPKDLGPRVTMAVGAIFAVAASSFSINSMLPESATLTMADRLIMAALSCVALGVLGTIFSLRLFYATKEKESARFDKLCGRFLPIFYVTLIGAVVALA